METVLVTLPDHLQAILERDKLGKMRTDVSLPSNAQAIVRLAPNMGNSPDRYVLDIRWNDECGRLCIYCDQETVEAIHRATEPKE